jgi:hypothetical protein
MTYKNLLTSILFALIVNVCCCQKPDNLQIDQLTKIRSEKVQYLEELGEKALKKLNYIIALTKEGTQFVKQFPTDKETQNTLAVALNEYLRKLDTIHNIDFTQGILLNELNIIDTDDIKDCILFTKLKTIMLLRHIAKIKYALLIKECESCIKEVFEIDNQINALTNKLQSRNSQ